MNKIIIAAVFLLSIFLAGCQTLVITKYQCQNGQVVDSIDLCSEVKCPKQIQNLTKYQCTDGTLKDSLSDCSISLSTPQTEGCKINTTTNKCYIVEESSNSWEGDVSFPPGYSFVNVYAFCNNSDEYAISAEVLCEPRKVDQEYPVIVSKNESFEKMGFMGTPEGVLTKNGWYLVCSGGDSRGTIIATCCKK